MSLGIHASVIALLILISSHPAIRSGARDAIDLLHARVARLVAPMPYRGGGGGGQRELPPASRGRLPKFAPHQFTPPSVREPEVRAILMIEPTLIGPPDVKLPEVDLARLGDPLGRGGPPSNGPGKGGGIGDGGNGGVGGHNGPGYGDDNGGGLSAVGFTGRITAPLVLYKVEPEFSEEARKAKYQGTVLMTIEVGEDGKPHRLRILRGLGLGLDEKAIEAVSRWIFKPAQRNGRPIRAAATIEVNFRLL
jgi:TonB family protein